MKELSPESFDAEVLSEGDDWRVVFFWGHDCPNCEIAKRVMEREAEVYREFPLRWFHVNTYHHFDLGTRFGLHGIPTFLFFRGGRLRARATSFPGHEEFVRILSKLTT